MVKLNKRDVSNPTIVNTVDINEPSSSKLIVEGNNIYVNKTNGNTGYLIPIEINGFKSDAIKVGSIKSSNGNITDDLKVGHNLNIGQSLNVGKGGILTNGTVAGRKMKTTEMTIDSNSPSATGLIVKGGTPQLGQTLMATDGFGNTTWGNTGVPIGTIVMWGGAENAIPTGWQLCDGEVAQDTLLSQLLSQGNPFGSIGSFPFFLPRVPDLRERFVVGAGGDNPTVVGTGYNVADLGGANSVTLTASQIPGHTHSVNAVPIPSSGAHNHTVNTGSGDDSPNNFIARTEAAGGFNYSTNAGEGSHTHTVPAHNTNTAGGITPPGGGSHENRPPFYALCFIIKTGF